MAMSGYEAYSYCNVEGKTDVGCKRPANEDWYGSFVCDNGLVAVVCDGMGGHVGGREASHLAVDSIRRFLETHYFDNPNEAIVKACDAANEAILQYTRERPELTGMGSTCVMLIVRNGKVFMGSVGDSRIYLVRSKRIRQLTKDQSFVQMLVDRGEITPQQAERHPRKNEITNALGLPAMQPATVLEDAILPEAGDCFLLCSDGLSGMVPDTDILKIVSNQGGLSQKERVDALIQKARANGGHDNITCQMVEFAIAPSSASHRAGIKAKWVRYVLAVVVLLLLGVGGYLLWMHNQEEQQSADAPKNPTEHRISYNDTIYYAAGTEFMTIEETRGYDALTMYIREGEHNKDTVIEKRALKLDSMQVVPNERIKVSRTGSTCSLVFTDQPFDKDKLQLRFKDGDSTYVYVFAVASVNETATVDSESVSEGVEVGDPADNGVVKNPVGQIVLVDQTSSSAKTIPLDYPVYIQSNTGTTVVTINSRKGTSTKDVFYIDRAIKQGFDEKGWYTYKCSHCDKCVVTIINNKVPKQNAIIDIPIDAEEEFVRIRVSKK